MNLTRIISGGQTGADQGGLLAAEELHLKTGGWAPKGWRTDEGPNPNLAGFGLVEHESSEYPPRTQCNVLASTGTLIFGDDTSPGCRLTKRYCLELGKPFQTIRRDEDLTLAKTYIRSFVLYSKIEVLNVAGNRERSSPGIRDWTKVLLVEALRDR